MATTATGEVKERALSLPLFRTITITDQCPDPQGRVEVTPEAGRIVFKNMDPLEYRIRLYEPGTDPDAGGGIDLLLPANGFLSVIIRKNDQFKYSVMPANSEMAAATGKGGGPITN
jgi:hypothetical protein